MTVSLLKKKSIQAKNKINKLYNYFTNLVVLDKLSKYFGYFGKSICVRYFCTVTKKERK